MRVSYYVDKDSGFVPTITYEDNYTPDWDSNEIAYESGLIKTRLKNCRDGSDSIMKPFIFAHLLAYFRY